MNERDIKDIKSLYFVNRFLPSSIAKLYGISHVTVLNIISREKNVTIVSDTECVLCGLEDVETFYIDGNPKNKKPQNVLSLCEADKRRLQHRQLKKKRGSLISQV